MKGLPPQLASWLSLRATDNIHIHDFFKTRNHGFIISQQVRVINNVYFTTIDNKTYYIHILFYLGKCVCSQFYYLLS